MTSFLELIILQNSHIILIYVYLMYFQNLYCLTERQNKLKAHTWCFILFAALLFKAIPHFKTHCFSKPPGRVEVHRDTIMIPGYFDDRNRASFVPLTGGFILQRCNKMPVSPELSQALYLLYHGTRTRSIKLEICYETNLYFGKQSTGKTMELTARSVQG